MTLVPTEEQKACIKAAKENQFVMVNAYAGCSKTTTLKMIADEIVTPSLYIAFNKSIADEAKAKFPSYVECKTSHSMAYAAVGKDYAHKLKRPQGRYMNVCGTGSEIANYFKIEDMKLDSGDSITSSAIGVAVRDTVGRFEQSSDLKIKSHHVSFSPVARFVEKELLDKKEWRKTIQKYAEKLWSLRTNTKTNILCTHDTYLKLWQLSKPDLSNYEIIYLDESQDSNPCLLDIIYSQKSKVVLVGDKYQAIYSWRGAVNAMDQDGGKNWKECLLSASFRYGESVAKVANAILDLDDNLLVKGNGTDSISHKLKGDENHTRIYRTNAALIADAVHYITKGKECSLEIDTHDLVKLLESAAALKVGNLKGVKHDDLVAYKSWYELEQESPSSIAPIISMVNKNLHYTALGVLKEHRNPLNPEIIFVTAHKSKGREWDTVVLAEDFKSPMVKGEFVGLTEEERNLLYVSATRAKKLLIYNQPVKDYLDHYDI